MIETTVTRPAAKKANTNVRAWHYLIHFLDRLTNPTAGRELSARWRRAAR
jgi:hypothetical protein